MDGISSLKLCGFLVFAFVPLLSPIACSPLLRCPNCGNASVPYPLSTSPNCGHPSFQIACTAQHTLEFMALSGTYPILSLNPSNLSMVLQASPFLGSSCITQDSLTSGNFSLNPSLPFSIDGRNTILDFNCSDTLRYSPLHCAPHSPCVQLLDNKAKNCKGFLCCSFQIGDASIFTYTFPVEGLLTSYMSVIDLDESKPVSSWNYGLMLQWSPPSEPPCKSQSDCGKNSTCLRAPGASAAHCLCNEGFFWDPFSGTCPKAPFCLWRGNSVRCHKIAYATGITSGSVVVILMFVLTVIAFRRRQATKRARDNLVKERSMILAANSGGKSARLFSSREMKKATNGFAKDNLLGSGGFGDVYKGVLDDKTVVAIKSAKIGNIKGTEQVLNEVRILSQVNHRNLVRLLGCCVETPEPLMVYEYVPNGNLFDHLTGSTGSFLDWKMRLQIAHQSAEALAYLHSAAYPPIYHRDVKTTNILLDKTLNARVSDFGLSRLAEADLTHISTCAQGTLGYLDPEYYRNYQVTDKSDVYSYGVVLLELVTSQRAIDFSREQDEVNLVVLVQTKAERGSLHEVFDPQLVQSASKDTIAALKAVTFLALDCLKENRNERPTMREVVEQLHYIIAQEAGGIETKVEGAEKDVRSSAGV